MSDDVAPSAPVAAELVPSSEVSAPDVSAPDDGVLADPWPPADDDVPFDWPGLPEDDPERWPVADEHPEPPAEIPQWLADDLGGSAEAEHAAWLAGLPDDIRADYLAGPYTGAGEAIGVGFTHRDDGGPAGAGFAAGGALDQLAPGPWLAGALADATSAGYDVLTDSEQIGVLLGWQRQAAWAQAGLAAALIGVRDRRLAQSARPGSSRLADHVTDEIAIALRLTSLSAGRLLGQAAGLDRLPQVAEALAAGRIDWSKACVLAGELAVLTDEQAHDIASRLLPAAGEQTTAQLRAELAREILAADPRAAERRKKEGRKDTRVEVWHEPSGNTVLAGRELRPADAITADAQLTADARWLRRHGAAGTLAELRATAYIARLSGRDLTSTLAGDTDGDAAAPDAAAAPDSAAAPDGTGTRHDDPADERDPARRRRGADGRLAGPPGGIINLTMPLSAFAGMSDRVGEVAGYGPVDADTGRELAARVGDGARWCLTLTGADGRAVAHGCARGGDRPEPGAPAVRWAAGLRDRLQFLASGTCSHSRQSASYTPPAALRHLIEIRQRTCFAPGCRRPAAHCDIDHTVPFDVGGITCECNTAPACRRHHRAKQAPGWHLAQDQPGTLTWELPHGRTYTVTAKPYPV